MNFLGGSIVASTLSDRDCFAPPPRLGPLIAPLFIIIKQLTAMQACPLSLTTHNTCLIRTKRRSNTANEIHTMPSALILIADGTEEIEFVIPYDGMLLHFHLPLHYSCFIYQEHRKYTFHSLFHCDSFSSIRKLHYSHFLLLGRFDFQYACKIALSCYHTSQEYI